jgi:DNA-binding MarR family transcriptional regulator
MKTRVSNVAAVRLQLRELSAQLGQLNHRVGMKSKLRDGDLACLDVLARSGPQSPSALAGLMKLHPATMTGVLDRLEAEGWVARERDPNDRRAVLVRPLPGRVREVMGLYGGMNSAIDRIAGSYPPDQLAVITDFLDRLIAAGKAASEELGSE